MNCVKQYLHSAGVYIIVFIFNLISENGLLGIII